MNEFMVKVGGIDYPAYTDINGVTRFKGNSIIEFLFKSGKLDLNQLAVDYSNGKFSKRDYAELNMMLGYSVSGFCDLSAFADMEVVTPGWRRVPSDDSPW